VGEEAWSTNVPLPIAAGALGLSSETIVGVVVGGLLGVAGTSFSSYLGPRKLEEWRERRQAERDKPRKRLLLDLLEEEHSSRSLELLTRATGTSDEECRRLLVDLGARGMKLKSDKEGWGLISRNPLGGRTPSSG
jgi:hypothetical protein